MELSIQNPFGDCDVDGHVPKWKPYPREYNSSSMPLGTVTCTVCLEQLDYGVPKNRPEVEAV